MAQISFRVTEMYELETSGLKLLMPCLQNFQFSHQ